MCQVLGPGGKLYKSVVLLLVLTGKVWNLQGSDLAVILACVLGINVSKLWNLFLAKIVVILKLKLRPGVVTFED